MWRKALILQHRAWPPLSEGAHSLPNTSARSAVTALQPQDSLKHRHGGQQRTDGAVLTGQGKARRIGTSAPNRTQTLCAGVSNTSPLEKTSKSLGSPSWSYQLRRWKQAGREPALSEPRDRGTHPINCTMLYLETASWAFFFFFNPFHSAPLTALAENSLPCQKQSAAQLGIPENPRLTLGLEEESTQR